MLNRTMLSLVFLAIITASMPALAQEEPADGGEVHSKIDGQLVPVGERNKYEYSYKKHLVSTNPLSYFLGSFAVGYNHAFSQNIAARVDLGFIHIWKTELYGADLSASVPIFFKKMNDGFYIEPGAYLMVLDVDGASAVAGGPHMLLGWSWIWDSGFNVNLGLGMSYTWISAEGAGASASIDGPFPKGRLAFGYAW